MPSALCGAGPAAAAGRTGWDGAVALSRPHLWLCWLGASDWASTGTFAELLLEQLGDLLLKSSADPKQSGDIDAPKAKHGVPVAYRNTSATSDAHNPFEKQCYLCILQK